MAQHQDLYDDRVEVGLEECGFYGPSVRLMVMENGEDVFVFDADIAEELAHDILAQVAKIKGE